MRCPVSKRVSRGRLGSGCGDTFMSIPFHSIQNTGLAGPASALLGVDIVRRELMPALAVSYFCPQICVTRIGSCLQVLWIAARRIMAFVMDNPALGNFTPMNDEGKPVGVIKNAALKNDSPISQLVLGACPIPAPGIRVLEDIRKQLGLQFFGNNHAQQMSFHPTNVQHDALGSMKIKEEGC